jgi:hypothetical protein
MRADAVLMLEQSWPCVIADAQLLAVYVHGFLNIEGALRHAPFNTSCLHSSLDREARLTSHIADSRASQGLAISPCCY